MMDKLVSIIIPCYNYAGIVERMLESVLNQTYSNIELIVVNDGSTDKSEDSILSFESRIRDKGYLFIYVKQDNQGLGAAINAGLTRVTGEYFCWADADDYYESNSIEARVKVLEENPEYAVVTSNAYIREFDNLEDKKLLAKDDKINNDPDQFLHHLNGDSIFCPGCHMVRMSMFRTVYPEMQIYPARRGQNWQLLLPLYYKYRRFFLNIPLYNYIIYPNSMSKDRDCLEDKIKRFDEHELILNQVINHIEKTEKVDVTEYRRFLDDKYAKLKLEVYIKYGNKERFIREYIKKQHNVGIDTNDRIAYYRMMAPMFRTIYRIVYRIAKGGVPEEIGEHIVYKINTERIAKLNDPRVSVLVPVYNGEKYIEQCFYYLLNQRYDNVEVIVVNDGSTDQTEQYLVKYENIFRQRGFAYRHVYQSNARLAVAMNNALKYVTGKYVMIYEIDDILYKDGILDKVKYLEDHPTIAMVRNNGYYIKRFDEVENHLFIYRKLEKDENRVFENILFGRTNNWPASYLIRVSDFFDILGESRKIYEHPGGTHLQFMLPMSYEKKVGFLDKPLMDYYAHIDSDSHSGGYEANMRRLQWYEEIRQGVIAQLDMPEKKRNEYSRKLTVMYDKNRMQLALNQHDREKFNAYAAKLGIGHTKANLIWAWHGSVLYCGFSFIGKVFSFIDRKIRIGVCNRRIRKCNLKGYGR